MLIDIKHITQVLDDPVTTTSVERTTDSPFDLDPDTEIAQGWCPVLVDVGEGQWLVDERGQLLHEFLTCRRGAQHTHIDASNGHVGVDPPNIAPIQGVEPCPSCNDSDQEQTNESHQQPTAVALRFWSTCNTAATLRWHPVITIGKS